MYYIPGCSNLLSLGTAGTSVNRHLAPIAAPAVAKEAQSDQPIPQPTANLAGLHQALYPRLCLPQVACKHVLYKCMSTDDLWGKGALGCLYNVQFNNSLKYVGHIMAMIVALKGEKVWLLALYGCSRADDMHAIGCRLIQTFGG